MPKRLLPDLWDALSHHSNPEIPNPMAHVRCTEVYIPLYVSLYDTLYDSLYRSLFDSLRSSLFDTLHEGAAR